MNTVVSVLCISTADLDSISESGLYVCRPHQRHSECEYTPESSVHPAS